MQKRLSPGLFEERSRNPASEKVQVSQPPPTFAPPVESYSAPATLQNGAVLPNSAMSLTVQAARLEAQKLTEEMKEIKGRQRSYENQIEVFKNQMTDFVRSVDQRFDRVSQALSRIEKAMHQQGRDGEERIKTLREKLNNQNLEDAKVESLIERQNVVIRNFENRLTSMQKIISDKEALLLKYHEVLRRLPQR